MLLVYIKIDMVLQKIDILPIFTDERHGFFA